MKRNLMLALLAVMVTAARADSAQIDAIEFKNGTNENTVEISGSGLDGYVQEEKSSPHELVITFANTSLAETAKQKFDSANLSGNVTQISSYSLPSGQARVVIDFKHAPKYVFEDTDKKVLVHLGKREASAQVSAPATPQSIHIAASSAESQSSDNDALSTVMSAETSRKFTGSPITLKLKDADVHEVLRLISETSGFNIIVHPSVSGKITVSLDHVPWDQALDVVLTTLKLGADRNESVLRVMPKEMLLKEKQDEIDQKKLVNMSAPRITRIFPISYADLSSLSTLLTNFANAQNTTPGSGGIPASILVDLNTQSLIVRDTAENVERMRKMIQLLDVQTPQVLIEAKTVEASEDFSSDLEGSIVVQGSGPSIGYGGNINAPSTTGTATSGSSSSSSASASGSSSSSAPRTNGISLTLGKALQIAANLTYAEQISKARIVSSPKTVVLSGKSSSINQVTAYSYTITNAGSVGVASTSQTVSASASTKLDVTPRVTNDGSVFMKLNLSRDVLNLSNPQAPIAEPRTLTTEVIVESGNTLVLGGVLNYDDNHTENGIPFLRKIPILGVLFGSDTDTSDKREIMFFITPRILNQKKTALASPDDVKT